MWFLKLVVLPPVYFICAWHDLHQRFSIPVLALPPCISCMSLYVNTPDSDNQLVRSALRAWTVSDWHAPYSLSREIRCSLLHWTFIHGLRCATSSSTDECDIICDPRTGIMEEYCVMSTSQGTYVRIEQTSEAIRVTYDMGRVRGLELRTADLHTACLLQVVLIRLFIKARCRLLK